MAAKKRYAIPNKVADIALRYGSNVSKGIQKMQSVIEHLLDEKRKGGSI